jgi:crotonobetainyl-CoA:carnitine CoA-transferase CaiB-like acyl-CoA transferase
LNHPTIAPYGLYRCGDGSALLFSIQNEPEWRRFCDGVLMTPEIAGDPRFLTNDDRVAHRTALDDAIGARFAALDGPECRRRLDTAAIAYGVMHDVAAFARHPHLRRIRVETAGGPVSVVAPPGSARERLEGRRVPAAGEHTRSLREEFP